ncbi:ethanolamine ammonia-lyase light chain EutC, partial [Bilophila wadsworthia]|uniref:ethanolamine ammonia-lyase light chain EutC n=1 Tax=Bilophila wadsworthia TaxID=35833 RepID=UPI00242C7DC8
VLSDGLSTDALLANYEEILPPLLNGLKQAGIRAGAPLFLRHGRVKAETSPCGGRSLLKSR